MSNARDRICKGICKLAGEATVTPVVVVPLREHNTDFEGIQNRVETVRQARKMKKGRDLYIAEQRKQKKAEQELYANQFIEVTPVEIAQPQPEYEKTDYFTAEEQAQLALEMLMENS